MRRIILTFIVAGFVGWGPLGPDAASALPTSATVYPLVCPGNAVADAQAKLGQPGVVFVDTRSPQEFSESHIPGAVNMPLPDVPNRFSELPQNAEIITYCT